MTTYRVSMQRSKTLSDDERRRRLHQAYLYILSLRPKKTLDQEQPGDQASPAVGDTATEELNPQDQTESDAL
jgi:hypothetical protein